MPFANIGGDPEQEYFVDGVTENLTTDLSRISGAFVIGRSTAFTYKGEAVDLKQIGRELNVRYVLEGSVQRGGNRMRVNVQLIDAEIGNHVWAERFEKPLADLLDMQDEIVARLANTLNAQLIAAEARRAERAPNPDSMDLYFQGMAWIDRGTTPDYMTQARGFFERALELDPRNVEALVGTASVDVMVSITYMTDDQATRLASAEAALARALSLAPEHALAHLMMGKSISSPTALAKALPNVSAHWLWIEIWPTLMLLSVLPRFLAVTPRKQRPMLMRPFASLRVTIEPTVGYNLSVPRSSIWPATRRPSSVRGAPLKSIAIIQLHNSTSRQPWRTSASSRKRNLLSKLALQPIRVSPFPASAPPWGAIVQPFSLSASGFTRACARPGCRRGEASLKTAHGSGCDARCLSTGRSIRA